VLQRDVVKALKLKPYFWILLESQIISFDRRRSVSVVVINYVQAYFRVINMNNTASHGAVLSLRVWLLNRKLGRLTSNFRCSSWLRVRHISIRSVCAGTCVIRDLRVVTVRSILGPNVKKHEFKTNVATSLNSLDTSLRSLATARHGRNLKMWASTSVGKAVILTADVHSPRSQSDSTSHRPARSSSLLPMVWGPKDSDNDFGSKFLVIAVRAK
jgi:hypothetical protein